MDSTTIKDHPYVAGLGTIIRKHGGKKEDCTNQGTSTSDDGLVKSSQCLSCSRGGVTTNIQQTVEGQARPSTVC